MPMRTYRNRKHRTSEHNTSKHRNKKQKSYLKFLILIIFLLVNVDSLKAEELKTFLRSCGYGTLVGGGVGLASLVFEKKPNESYSNIARGASLGLYFGIGYGIFLMNQNKIEDQENLTSNAKEKIKDLKYTFFPTPDGSVHGVVTFNFF